MRNQTPPLAPGLLAGQASSTVYLVLDDFGPQLGRVYRETDEAADDEAIIVENIIGGEYTRPVRVVAFNVAEGWARDVTDAIARCCLMPRWCEGACSANRRASLSSG
jgi:hypothetical protein